MKKPRVSVEELEKVMLATRREFARKAKPVEMPKDMADMRLGTVYGKEYAGTTA